MKSMPHWIYTTHQNKSTGEIVYTRRKIKKNKVVYNKAYGKTWQKIDESEYSSLCEGFWYFVSGNREAIEHHVWNDLSSVKEVIKKKESEAKIVEKPINHVINF